VLSVKEEGKKSHDSDHKTSFAYDHFEGGQRPFERQIAETLVW